jgi:hypothetical protein
MGVQADTHAVGRTTVVAARAVQERTERARRGVTMDNMVVRTGSGREV